MCRFRGLVGATTYRYRRQLCNSCCEDVTLRMTAMLGNCNNLMIKTCCSFWATMYEDKYFIMYIFRVYSLLWRVAIVFFFLYTAPFSMFSTSHTTHLRPSVCHFWSATHVQDAFFLTSVVYPTHGSHCTDGAISIIAGQKYSGGKSW